MAATPADEFETAAGRVPLPPWPVMNTLPSATRVDAQNDPLQPWVQTGWPVSASTQWTFRAVSVA